MDFPEPAEVDDTPARRGETTWDWLRRSTWVRAVETRAFYNTELAELPESARRTILSAMRAGDSESALLEMLVGRFLQVRGASELEYEPQGGQRHVDWRAVFPDGQLHVEAISPVYNSHAGELARRHDRLLELIESRIPDGWWLLPFRLPALEGHASLREFRRVAEELIAGLPPADAVAEDTILELGGRIREGPIRITAYRKDEGGMGGGAMIGYADDSEEVVRATWLDRRKRRQGRSTPPPALLAIAGGFLGADLDHFDRALFGRDVRLGREPAGVMIEDDPPWAGVLAFPSVSPASAEPPVLFMAPRYAGPPLPAAIVELEVRRMVAGGVEVDPSKVADVWAGVRFASMAR